MTLEVLLGKGLDELEKLTDSQLEEYFKDSLHVTRPTKEMREEAKEKAVRVKKPTADKEKMRNADKLLEKYKDLLND